MQIFIIVIKEIIEGVRDFKSMILMIIMPTILTVILGMALNNDISKEIDLSSIRVIYSINESSYDETNIIYEYLNNIEELGINCVQKDKEDISLKNDIIIDFYDIKNINIIYHNNNKVEGECISYILDNLMEKNNFTSILENEGILVDYKNQDDSYINFNPIIGEYSTSSLDYYGITMIVITIMFASVTGAYKVIREKQSGTLNKIRTIPISTFKLLIGKVIGSLIVILLQIIMTLFISKNVLNVNWGENICLIIFILLCQGVLAISIGVFIGVLLEDNKSAWLILLSLIMTLGFFSGSFFQIGQINNKWIFNLSKVNLLKAENTAIFNYIYNGNSSLIIKISAGYILISIILINISSKIMEEAK